MKHPIGKAQNNAPVYVDLIHSDAAAHIAQQPHLLGLVGEALQKTALVDALVSLEQDMGRVIGYDFVVATAAADAIFYAQLVREDVYTRFVKHGKPAPTQHLALILRRDDGGEYELLDTWIGRLMPPRPGSTDETSQSKSYWSTHALILDNQSLQSRTLTKVCPY